jgi:uncharacterized membrane protein
MIWGFIFFLILFGTIALDSLYLFLSTMLFGVVIYGVLVFTNHKILPRYKMSFGVIDILWVSLILTALTYVVRKFV